MILTVKPAAGDTSCASALKAPKRRDYNNTLAKDNTCANQLALQLQSGSVEAQLVPPTRRVLAIWKPRFRCRTAPTTQSNLSRTRLETHEASAIWPLTQKEQIALANSERNPRTRVVMPRHALTTGVMRLCE